MEDIKDQNQSDQELKEESKKEKKNKQKEVVEKLEAEVVFYKDKYLRSQAELENFKKRMQQERIQDRKYASKNLIGDLLVALDQLNTAVNMKTDNDLLKNFLIGFKMINDQLFNVLFQDGLKEIEALDKPFDPNLHYAVDKVSILDKPNGTNIEVMQKGYTYKDQLLRPAMVKINEWSEENGKDK